MRIIFIGDVFGRPGRDAVKGWLPGYRHWANVDFVIANGENAAGGKGITQNIAEELFSSEVDVLTGGNHSFHLRESYEYFKKERRLLRPANMHPECPGRGYEIYDSRLGKIAILNLMGRAFISNATDCPFRYADEIVAKVSKEAKVILVDFHAEATSEKQAMFHHLDGRVSAVIGTHTHVATTDAHITRNGTAAITDVGMTGPYDSVIGVDAQIVLRQIVTGMPVRHEVASEDVRISALQVDVDTSNGKAGNVELIQYPDWFRGHPPV